MTWLTTREAVKAALDIAETARANDQIDRAIATATGTVEGYLHRRFRPVVATKTFSWPRPGGGWPWVLRLNHHELISITTLTAAGVEIASTDYLLEPQADGPPFTRVEIDRSSPAAFTLGDTPQRAISITGLWGHSNNEATAGALTAAVSTTTATTITVTDGSAIGIGDVVRVDSERLNVTGRSWTDTTVNLTGDLAANKAGRIVSVSTAAGFTAGERILIDAEQMLIDDVVGDTLLVRRSWDGSVLAAHTTGADVHASRRLTVERGTLGTTAATHADAAQVWRHVVPPAVDQLVLLEALVVLGLGRSGGASTAGEGAASVDTSGGGLEALRVQVRRDFGRKARMRTV